MKALPQVLEELKEYGVKGGPENLTTFHDRVYIPYIQNVIENLHDRFPDNPVLEALTLLDPDLLGDDPSEHDWIHQTKLQVMKHMKYLFNSILFRYFM